MSLYDKIFKPSVIVLSNGKEIVEKKSRTPLVLLILLIFSIISLNVTGFKLSTIITRGHQFWDILIRMFPPNVKYTADIWTPLFDTIKMSFLGSIIGSVFAIPMAMVASSNLIKSKAVITVMRFLLSIVRTLPSLVTALIATYIFGLGTTAGTTAIAIYTFSYIGKLLYEQIETIDMGPIEAAEALGSSKIKTFISSVIPQILPGYLSNSLYCFEGNVRYASILGYVGAGGLGLILNENIGWREYDKVGMTLIMLFFTVVIIEAVSHYLRKKLT